jgi:ribonuclease-3
MEVIISNQNLATVCDDSGMTRYINGNPSQQGVHSPKTRAATVEAVLGAIYMDSGKDINAVKAAMRAIGLAVHTGTG